MLHKKSYSPFRNYLSEDAEFYPAIEKALRQALVNNPKELIDNITIDRGNGDEDDTIAAYEKCEYSFTVEEFCELAGITVDNADEPLFEDKRDEFIEKLIGNMDWLLLRSQKKALVEITLAKSTAFVVRQKHIDAADGILNMIDFIMDSAVDIFGETSKQVFGKNYPSTK